MAAASAKIAKVAPSSSASTDSSRRLDPREQISSRESRELLLAVSGPVGSGQSTVIAELQSQLAIHNYTPVVIKLSSLLEKMIADGCVIADSAATNRYTRLQSAGNNLRDQYGCAVLAELAIGKIAALRLRDQGEEVANGSVPPRAVAWIIDQLKHPDEAALLSQIYGNIFFLVGVFSHESQRELSLRNELSVTEDEALEIIRRDRDENFAHGQKLDKTLQRADYFIRNSHGTSGHIQSQVRRFLDLIHAKNGITPSVDESGMYAAYSAAMRSACLSRQVGAAIVNVSGCVVATGCNDVPKAGGGLYNESDKPDYRCFNKGLCFNDKHKLDIERQIRQLLVQDSSLGLTQQVAENVARKLREFTRIKDLIEFSRSVHAEMDAIVALARNGGASTLGCSLYTTTFPCHNCARHIVAAGIARVLFIEPYEKSLAAELHGEDIAFVEQEGDQPTTRVRFLHFEGAAPRRFQAFFLAGSARKDGRGKSIQFPLGASRKAAPSFLDTYFDYEKKVSELLDSRGLSPVEA